MLRFPEPKNARSQRSLGRSLSFAPLTASLSNSLLHFVLILHPLALGCFALSPPALAVTPAPDGGYPGGNTGEGKNALFSLTTGGANNTAVGLQALFKNTTGGANTAIGSQTLLNNTTGGANTATGGLALGLNTTGSDNTANGWDQR